ncbi:MAG: PIN domain-containing protein [Acidobacteria bacterium]|nr:PIN domain-containing protein [Acidobacteriota bacterium]
MRGRTFLDTNIFIYSLEHQEKRKSSIARQIIEDALKKSSGVISYQVVQEFINVSLRGFEVPFKPADRRYFLNSVMFPLTVVQPSYEFYMQGLDIHENYRFSWYDSLIVAAALQAECETLYTEDLQHGQKIGAMRIVNPFV